MSLPRVTYPKKDSRVLDESQRCSLPELYASIENFSKEKKKSNLLNTHSMSLKEAQQMLAENLNTMSLSSRTGESRKDPQSVLTDAMVNKEGEKPEYMTELLHRSLVTGSLSPVNRLSQSQKRLAQRGIPPPKHTFPYDIINDLSNTLSSSASWNKVQATILSALGLPGTTPEKLTTKENALRYLLVDPEKQFIDLRDLEWRYFKGHTKWKHRTAMPSVDIKYDTEKRYVESQNMPGVIFPPVVQPTCLVERQSNNQGSNDWLQRTE